MTTIYKQSKKTHREKEIPPNQYYLITEEDICTIRDYILGAFYEGENKERIYDLIKSEFSVIRSHPYNPQAEREKVLDELESRYKFLINESGIQGFSKIMERNVLSNLLPLFRQYQELRKRGEQE